MKVFIVYFETISGHTETALLIMRKIYQQAAISVRRYRDTDGLSEVESFNTEAYTRAADLFLDKRDGGYKKIKEIVEVKMA